MLDIGFFELLVVAVVLIIVMGPERLPEVAKQAAFYIRKARQGMFRLRSEMQSEMEGTPFADLQQAKREMSDFKNDMKQFGRDLADSAEEKIEVGEVEPIQAEPSQENPTKTSKAKKVDDSAASKKPQVKKKRSAKKKPQARKKTSSTISSKSD